LYLAHLALQLLWFQDPSAGQKSAAAALDLLRDLLGMVPSDHPLVAMGLMRVRQVTAPLLEER